MPRLNNVNLLGVLLAAVAIYLVGFVWYGLLFSEIYMNGIGVYFNDAGNAVTWMTPEGAQTQAMAAEPVWMASGFIIPLVLAFGLGWHMKQRNITSLNAALSFGLWLSLLIGVPLMAYTLVYSPWHSWAGFAVNGSHTVVSILAGCAVLSRFD